MIRVAFPESTTLEIGGYQHSTFDIIEHLAETTDEVSLYYVTHDDTPARRAARERNLPAKVITLGRRGFPGWRDPLWILGYLWRAWRFLRRERIDIVHGSNETFLFWLLPCLASGAVPVWNVRAEVSRDFRGRLRQWLHLLVCRHVIFVSDATRRSVERNGLPKRVHWTVIRNFVPLRLIKQPEERSAKQEVDVGFVGRIDDPVKNVDRALHLALRVVEKTDSRARFGFWGHVSDARRKAIEQRIPTSLGNRIQLHGPSEDVSRLYGNTDVLLLTSRSEGAPRVIMEAGVQGVPAVATSVGGVPELIVSGETGYLFESDDEGESYLTRLVNDDELRRELGRRAREHFLKQFGHTRIIGQYTAFYRECLHGRGGGK